MWSSLHKWSNWRTNVGRFFVCTTSNISHNLLTTSSCSSLVMEISLHKKKFKDYFQSSRNKLNLEIKKKFWGELQSFSFSNVQNEVSKIRNHFITHSPKHRSQWNHDFGADANSANSSDYFPFVIATSHFRAGIRHLFLFMQQTQNFWQYLLPATITPNKTENEFVTFRIDIST